MSKPSPSRGSRLRDTLNDLTALQRIAALGVFVCLGLKTGLHVNVGEFLTVFGAMLAYEGARKAKGEAE